MRSERFLRALAPLSLVIGCNSPMAGVHQSSSAEGPPTEDPSTAKVTVDIPTDTRTAVHLEDAPPPVSGGSLLVTQAGTYVLAADPDRDRVAIVDVETLALRSVVSLRTHDEPGRLVEDSAGMIHVALRRSGDVATIDPAGGTLVRRRHVCQSPRGLAYRKSDDTLHVACAEGVLVSLPAGAGAVTRTLHLDSDLRDVISDGTSLWVTRFRTAELLQVAADGSVVNRSRPDPMMAAGIQSAEPVPENDSSSDNTHGVAPLPPPTLSTFDPEVAWRTVPVAGQDGADTRFLMLHQSATVDQVVLNKESALNGSPYGGSGGGCGGIVRGGVTMMSGGQVSKTFGLGGSPLTVDAALSPSGYWLAFASAGAVDRSAPSPTIHFDGNTGGAAGISSSGPPPISSLVVVSASSILTSAIEAHHAIDGDDCLGMKSLVFSDQPLIAVAFHPKKDQLFALQRNPSRIAVYGEIDLQQTTTVELGGDPRADTGHDLFHRDGGQGIACASCHPEGGDDGHVWKFSDLGERRTQSLHAGLKGTFPLHWDGALKDIGAVMEEVFVGRMGGVHESSERIDALSSWLFALPKPKPSRSADDPAVQRGHELFASSQTGCSDCHAGAKLTNNETVDVGTGGRFQVPSLVAVGDRAPYLHNGCAATLQGRFDPNCGGRSHGHTEQLDSSQKDDIVAYLLSL